MRTFLSTVVGLGLVALLAAPATAQGQGRGFGMGGMGGYATLLGNASVQKELKLEDQQVEKAKDLAEKTRQEMRSKLEGLDGQERFEKMREIGPQLNESALKSANEFLKPEQIARLKQISCQVRGAMAFNDAEIAKKLNLTDSQKTDIQQVIQDSRSQMPSREDFQNDREAATQKMREVGKATLAKVEGKLNDEQQKTWKEMLGAPFEIKYEPRPNN
jgi:Spy/CpxP family protein refolding chaperone